VRRLVAAIFAGFALLLAVTLYLASRKHEGLVDRNYYESASNEFAERELEARERFVIRVPDRYRAGENRFVAAVATAAGPLRGARVTLTAMRPSGTVEDRRYALREGAPGRYEGAVTLPSPGAWMLSLAVDAGRFRSRRLWTVVALPGEAPVPADNVLRAAAGDQEVLLAVSPWPPPAMRELAFSVELPGYDGTAPPRIDLSMRGMEMGRNRVLLGREADGVFRGTGVFVRCPSGRKDWQAEVTVPGRGKAVFLLDVAD
jgi:nitrogen fixation protein FixH